MVGGKQVQVPQSPIRSTPQADPNTVNEAVESPLGIKPMLFGPKWRYKRFPETTAATVYQSTA